ncbi:hypothetical protein LMG29542_02499 [Paraburkholderia humisilvae]|uniref:Uncharacterized protein n=1 Tax=Paraburkholderia humisilvae TaxID=627669 RepID=A0A6J5DN55_9BURK|nr:hypothetical protein LMG29542_02499 [Paraburkholderia humisilvae]
MFNEPYFSIIMILVKKVCLRARSDAFYAHFGQAERCCGLGMCPSKSFVFTSKCAASTDSSKCHDHR